MSDETYQINDELIQEFHSWFAELSTLLSALLGAIDQVLADQSHQVDVQQIIKIIELARKSVLNLTNTIIPYTLESIQPIVDRNDFLETLYTVRTSLAVIIGVGQIFPKLLIEKRLADSESLGQLFVIIECLRDKAEHPTPFFKVFDMYREG
ncbi:MAG: hypothetical protein ABI947_28350 [Chloroflexota bacterium]